MYVPRQASFAQHALEADPNLKRITQGSSLLHRFRAELPRVNIDGQQYYVAEGDTLLDDDQLAVYAFGREKADEAMFASRATDFAGLGMVQRDVRSSALIAMTQGGKIVRWRPGLVLRYRIARATFRAPELYHMVVDCMHRATLDWEQTCGVQFFHAQDLDAAPGVNQLDTLFVVRELDAGGRFIASAFFPNDPVDRRKVFIDPSFYDPDLRFDKAGIVRHELGHVLGFRHEHIRSGAPPVCPGEPLYDTQPLTQYDPQSVMHYFCGGVGTNDLRITALDRAGAQQVYGPPLAATSYIDG